MMGVARLTPADQAGLPGNEPHMIAIADAPRLGVHQDGFVDRWRRQRRRGLSFLATSICRARGPSIVLVF
jgi:hypothetical protein